MRIPKSVALTVILMISSYPALGQDATVPAEWKSLDVAGLTKLAVELTNKGSASADQRQKLAQFVAQKFDAASSAGALSWDQWMGLANVLADRYPAATRQAMADSLQRKYFPTPQATSSLDCPMVQAVCGTLDSLGKKDLATASVVAWIDGRKDCKVPVDLLLFFTAKAGQACLAGDAGKSARVKLIDYITSTYCQNDESTRKLSLPIWRGSVMNLFYGMTPQVKAQWAQRVKSAYGDPQALGDARAYETLSRTLGQLGVAPTEVATKLTAGGTAWQSWTLPQLASLADALFKAGDAGKDARTKLGLFISSKFVSTNEAARELPLPIWKNLVKCLNLELSADARSAWAARLMDAYSETTAFKADQWVGLIESLKQLRKEDVPKAWSKLAQGNAWESWGMEDLLWLDWQARDSGPEGKGFREKLGSHITATFAKDPGTMRSVPLYFWRDSASCLGNDLSYRDRNSWAKKLQETFGPSVDQDRNYLVLDQAVSSLNQQVSPEWTQKWAKSGVWQSWSPGYGLPYGARLKQNGEGKRFALYFEKASDSKDFVLEWWFNVACVAAEDFSPEAREGLVKKIQTKFLSSPQATASLDCPMVQAVCDTLDSLGKKDLAAASVVTWIDGRKDCKVPVDLLLFFTAKAGQAGDAGKSARVKLINYITSTYCQNDESARKLSLPIWRGSVMNLFYGMTPQVKAQWAQRVKSAYGDPQALGDATAYETLSGTLGQLGVAPTEVATKLTTGGTAWQSWTLPQLASLADALFKAGDAGREARVRLYGYITQKYINAPAKAPLAYWNELAYNAGNDLPDPTKTLWSRKLQETFGPSVDQDRNYLVLDQAVSNLKQQVSPEWTQKWAKSGVWQSWSPGYGLPYGARLKINGEGKRFALYFEKASDSKDFVLEWWFNVACVAAEDFSPEAREGLVKKIQTKFLSSPQATSSLDCPMVQAVCGTLDSLGKKDLATASVVAWIDGRKDCKVPVDLLLFFTAKAGQACLAGDAGKSARVKLINYITSTYCQNDESTRKLSLPIWRGSVMNLFYGMTPQVKAQWAQRVKSAYGDPQALGDATAYETFSRTLGQLGVTPTEVATKLTAGGTTWQSWSVPQLENLADALFQAGDAGKDARAKLGLFISSKFISTNEAAREVSLPIWRNLVKYLNLELSADAKSAWAARLMDAYSETTAFKADQWVGLIESLKQLRKEDVPKAWSKLAQGNAWESWGMEDLLWLDWQARDSGPEGKGFREKLGSHITATFAKDPGTMRSVPLYFWRDSASCLGNDLSYRDRNSWAKKLQETFGPSVDQDRNYLVLDQAVSSLNQQVSPEWTRKWAKSGVWQSWNPGDFPILASAMRGLGERGHQARLRLAEFISNKYMAGAASTASITLPIWREITRCVSPDLTKDVAGRWCDKLCEAFAGNDSALMDLDGKDLRVLGEAVAFLDGNRAAEIVAKWVDGSTKSRATSVDDSIGMGAALAGSTDPQNLKRLKEMDAVWVKWAREGRLNVGQCETIFGIWNSADSQKGKQWAQLMYRSLFNGKSRGSPVLIELTRVGMWLLRAELVGKDKTYPEFTEAAAVLAGQGKISFDVWFDYAYLAAPLAAPNARKAIQGQLMDDKGCPRIGVGKILAAAHMQAGEYKSWAEHVDKKISDSSGNADAKACWLVIKGYGESLVHGDDPVWPRVKKWLDIAFSTAESSQTRLAVVREICAFYVNTNRPAAGLAILKSVEQQFTGDDLAMAQDIEARLTELAAQAKDKRAIDAGNANASAQRSLLKYYRDRLAVAQSAGQQDKATKIEALIQDLESQLDK